MNAAICTALIVIASWSACGILSFILGATLRGFHEKDLLKIIGVLGLFAIGGPFILTVALEDLYQHGELQRAMKTLCKPFVHYLTFKWLNRKENAR